MKRDNRFGRDDKSPDPEDAHSWIWLVTLVVAFSAIANALA